MSDERVEQVKSLFDRALTSEQAERAELLRQVAEAVDSGGGTPDRTGSDAIEIVHFLFTDLVGYSLLKMDEQRAHLAQLQDIVLQSPRVRAAEVSGGIIRLPTGDGMALAFSQDPLAPVQCAVEVAAGMKNLPHLKLRMGIHSGPVYRVFDVNHRSNVAGSGINIAQRVMDCGDAGHILVSKSVADVLLQLSQWAPFVTDLSEVEVKHGVRVHIFNLVTRDAGNPDLPGKLKAVEPKPRLVVPPAARPGEDKIAVAGREPREAGKTLQAAPDPLPSLAAAATLTHTGSETPRGPHKPEAVTSVKTPKGMGGIHPGGVKVRRNLAIAVGLIALTAAGLFLLPTHPPATAAALRWYNQGVDAIREGTYYKGVRALEQSLKESPGFPLTHASLAEAWLELDSPERANEEMLRASAPGGGADHLDSRERQRLQAIDYTVTRDYAKAVATYTTLAATASAAGRPGALVDLGRALERSSEPAKAREQYERAVHLDPSYAGGWLRLAMVEGQLQQSQKMEEALKQAESLYDAASILEGETEVHYQRGTYANRQSRLNDAEMWLEKARQEALATQNPHQQIRALYQLSAVAYQRGDTATAQKLAEQAVGEARNANIEFLAVRAYLDLGNAMSTRGDYGKAAEYFNELARLSRNYHNGRLEATALYSLGVIATRNHPDEAGTRQVEQALAWFQANGYPREASYCLVVLGRIRRDGGDLAGAGEAFNKQLELARASHDDLQTVVAMSSVVSILFLQERFPEALDLTLQQMSILGRMGDRLRAAYTQVTLAQLYAELGRFDEAASAAQAAETAARERNMGELLVDVAVTRARMLLLSGRLQEAAALASQGIHRNDEAKYQQQTGELFGTMALAGTGASFRDRLTWCERGLKLASGSLATELSLQLTEAELLLQAGKSQAALDLDSQVRKAFERQQSEYSLFRAELIAALVNQKLGRKDGGAVTRAAAALERFRKRFADSDWDRFKMRPDFQHYEKNMVGLHS